MNHISHMITALGTVASIISLAFAEKMPELLKWIIIIGGLGCFLYLIIEELKINSKNERVCKNTGEIEDAMKDIIKSDGQICIMSRDLSWVTPEITGCLEGKKESVLIFAQAENDTTTMLEARGIKVKYYGELNFEPKTRFTIIRYNKTDPQVAIANIKNTIRKKNQFRHVIYQTSPKGNSQDEWINSLAIDMVSLCNAVTKEKEYAKEN